MYLKGRNGSTYCSSVTVSAKVERSSPDLRKEHQSGYIEELVRFVMIIDQDLADLTNYLKNFEDILKTGKAKGKVEITNVRDIGRALASDS